MEGVLDLPGFTRLEEATAIDGDFLAAVGPAAHARGGGGGEQ